MRRARRTRRPAGTLLALAALALAAAPAQANPPAPEPMGAPAGVIAGPAAAFWKGTDMPDPKEVLRLRRRRELLESGQAAEAAALELAGQDRALVILVEFGGTDTFTWTNGASTWDPLGDPDASEYTGTAGDCSRIAAKLGIAAGASRDFTYSGPLHNAIERPRSATDPSGASIWTPDFSKAWFESFLFGGGAVFDYQRQDGSVVQADFSGKSVRQYFADLSTGAYTVNGDVIGWVQVPHSTWYYDADQCPGARSGASASRGAIPGAGTARTLVKHALDALAALPADDPRLPAGFGWANYDRDGDGVIDRLWVVHAGYGEEDTPALLRTWDDPATPGTEARTSYGEAAIWSHASAITPAYPVPGTNVAAGAYIVVPENGGIGVVAHEHARSLGADDLHAYGEGEASAGFWTLMADHWTGHPLGFQPPSLDPMHLDRWGWLDPRVVTDAASIHEVTLGQASSFPGGTNVSRGVKVPLPDGAAFQPVAPLGGHYWWGGKQDLANGMMTLKTPLALPAGAAALSLSFSLARGIQPGRDFLWVQASEDGGGTWKTLTNANTTCSHDADWIGGLYGFPDDLCAAGIRGFTDYNPEYPRYGTQAFDLAAFKGRSVLLRFWYMTDWASLHEGPFIDDIAVTSDSGTLFADGAEGGGGNWTYTAPWLFSDGSRSYRHAYYLQWRNTKPSGGYDAALGDASWRFGPADGGLLVWYNNELYSDNEVFNYVHDFPGWGPKGLLLLVDAHPEPWREPYLVGLGFDNEGGNVTSRMQMRDAAFGLAATAPFELFPKDGFVHEQCSFPARPAVSVFDDALDWFPGAEYVSRGPGYDPPAYSWVTRAWDASVVVPSTIFYGVKAPGYVGTGAGEQEFRYACSHTETGRLLCYSYGTGSGIGYDGGDGRPGTVGGSHGWRFEVVDAAADGTWGKVRISRDAPPTAADQFVLMPKDASRPITLVATDPEGRPLTWTVATSPAHGFLGGTAPALTYTPAAGFVGDDTFTFHVSDGHARSNVATVRIAVRAVRRAAFVSAGTQDGWLLESGESSARGGSRNVAGATILLGDDALDRQYRGILSFNTAALPDAAEVLAATASVRRARVAGANPFVTHRPLLLDIRSGRFGTSVDLQVSDFQAAPSRSAAAAFGVVPGTTRYSARLPASALAFVNRAGTTQVRLRFGRDDNDDRGGDTLAVYSGNAPAVVRPKLLVDYVAP